MLISKFHHCKTDLWSQLNFLAYVYAWQLTDIFEVT